MQLVPDKTIALFEDMIWQAKPSFKTSRPCVVSERAAGRVCSLIFEAGGSDRTVVQLRYHTDLSGQEYVTQKGWQNASLSSCPRHPGGGCGIHRHGTYSRKTRWGYALIVRYYCRNSQTTFSLLPDCFAARMPGTLAQIEQVVVQSESGLRPVAVGRAARGVYQASNVVPTLPNMDIEYQTQREKSSIGWLIPNT